jgi:hypothetical protein
MSVNNAITLRLKAPVFAKGRVAQIILETAERGCLSRSTFDNPKTRGISCAHLAIRAAAGGTPALRSIWAKRPKATTRQERLNPKSSVRVFCGFSIRVHPWLKTLRSMCSFFWHWMFDVEGSMFSVHSALPL